MTRPDVAPETSRAVVLLRGVNVGAHHRIAMPAFAAALESVGCRGVRTHLQSGNAVVTRPQGPAGEPAALAQRVGEALAAREGLRVAVLVRTAADLAAVLAANPLGEPADPRLLHVAFLDRDPAPEALAALGPAAFAPDEVRPGPRALYLRYATGVQGSRLSVAALERRLGVVASARNWRTVTALAELAGAPGPG